MEKKSLRTDKHKILQAEQGLHFKYRLVMWCYI